MAMERARRHQRLLARLALGLLALIAELVGRSLTHRLDFGRHVGAPSYSSADYYPILLAVVKVGVALMLARLAWRAPSGQPRAASSGSPSKADLLRHPHRPADRRPRAWSLTSTSGGRRER